MKEDPNPVPGSGDGSEGLRRGERGIGRINTNARTLHVVDRLIERDIGISACGALVFPERPSGMTGTRRCTKPGCKSRWS